MKHGDLTAALGCMLILFSILLGCADVSSKGVYRGYSGVEPAESEFAVLDLGTADEAIIDDTYHVSRRKYSTAKLLAGVHKIKWTASFGVSVLIEPSGYAAFGVISNVNFEAGHVYKFSQDRTTGRGYKVFFWIEDMTSGKIVWGTKKP
jgi:hypothetical protein